MSKESQSSAEYAVIGNLTRDRIITDAEVLDGLGGAAFFVSKTLLDLGNRVRLHTNSDEVPSDLSTRLEDVSGLHSPIATVSIDERQNRASVDYPGKKILFSNIPPEYFTVDCSILDPTFGEVTPDDLRLIRNAQEQIVAADIQGFLRVFDPITHATSKKQVDLGAFEGFDIIKMNKEEVQVQFPGSSLDTAAQELQRLGITVCLFTLGSEGSLVYADHRYKIPSIPITPRHTVGAGDTFFAAFLNSYVHGRGANESAKAATEYTARYLSEV